MVKLGMLMDPIANIQVHHDTSFAMLLESERRGFENYYLEPHDIWLQDGITWGRMRRIYVEDDANHWYDFEDATEHPLAELDVLLMRKDPPFNLAYIYLTYLLELAEAQGLMVINKPASLRDANEKLFTSWFPQCCPKTLVTSQPQQLKEFVWNEEETVIKPLSNMGGRSVFRAHHEDRNLSVIIENLTDYGAQLVMAQKYIPEINAGDKRVLMVDGEPIPYALARIPAEGDFRGNMVAGASIRSQELTDRDRWICEEVGPTLKEKGLLFVGLDIIGDYLTEINVTSPTCARELDRECGLNICSIFFDAIEARLKSI